MRMEHKINIVQYLVGFSSALLSFHFIGFLKMSSVNQMQYTHGNKINIHCYVMTVILNLSDYSSKNSDLKYGCPWQYG